MPTYNRAHVILDAVESVRDQSYQDWELLIVDDGSTDKTADIMKIVTKNDNRIRYKELGNNFGVSVARNKGLSLAQGEYVAYLDSDNYMYRDWLECMVGYLERNSTVSWLYPRLNTSIIDHERSDEKLTLTESIVPAQKKIPIEALWSMEFQADPNGLVHQRNLVIETNIQWDEKIESYGDYDYALQLSHFFPDGFGVHPFALGRYVRTYGVNGMCSNRGYPEIIAGLKYLQHKHRQFTTWKSLNDIDRRVTRYNECLQREMRPIDGLREKYGAKL